MLSDCETKGLTVLNSMTGRDISCLWNCYSLFAQREFIEALQEISKNFQRSNESVSDWSVPGDITVCFQVSLCNRHIMHYSSGDRGVQSLTK